jgi:hypothetical protein
MKLSLQLKIVSISSWKLSKLSSLKLNQSPPSAMTKRALLRKRTRHEAVELKELVLPRSQARLQLEKFLLISSVTNVVKTIMLTIVLKKSPLMPQLHL